MTHKEGMSVNKHKVTMLIFTMRTCVPCLMTHIPHLVPQYTFISPEGVDANLNLAVRVRATIRKRPYKNIVESRIKIISVHL